MLEATFNGQRQNGKNFSYTKECVRSWKLIAAVEGKLQCILDCRFYMARSADGASPVYCSFWLHSPEHHTSGNGKATGYGYDKIAGALESALDSAGITIFDGSTPKRNLSTEQVALTIGQALPGVDMSLHYIG